MQVIKNILLVVSVAFLFTACFSNKNLTHFSKKTKELSFVNNKQTLLKVPFSSSVRNIYITTFCVRDSFTINEYNEKYGKLFLEYIDLDSTCRWTGLANSFFETSLRQEMNLDILETVEKYDIDNYTFKTYKINEDSYLSAVYIYSTFSNTFLLDYEGKLYTELLKKLKPTYKNLFVDKKRFEKNYDKSLVKKNIFERYFTQDKERF